MNLKHFIGRNQLACLRDAMAGEEAPYFRDLIEDLKATIAAMPKTYDTEGQEAKIDRRDIVIIEARNILSKITGLGV